MGLSKGLDSWLALFHAQTDVHMLWIEGGPALALHLLCRDFWGVLACGILKKTGVSLSRIPSTLATMTLALLYLRCQCRGSLAPTVLLYLPLNLEKIPSALVTQIPELFEEGAWALSALNL